MKRLLKSKNIALSSKVKTLCLFISLTYIVIHCIKSINNINQYMLRLIVAYVYASQINVLSP